MNAKNSPKVNLPFSRKAKTVGNAKFMGNAGKGSVSLSASSPGTTGGTMWPTPPDGSQVVPVVLSVSQQEPGGAVKVELLEARVDYLEAALLRAEANILELRGEPISLEQRQEIENRAAQAHKKLQSAQLKSH